MGESNGQRTPGGAIMDGRGRDGQHRDDHTRAADNGQRTRTSAGEVGQRSGHDIQNSVPKPAKNADTSTEEAGAEERMETEGNRDGDE